MGTILPLPGRPGFTGAVQGIVTKRDRMRRA
jgi:hypothetical protein